MAELKYIHESLKWINRRQNKDSILVLQNKTISLFVLFDWVSSSENAKEWIKLLKLFLKNNFLNYINGSEFRLKDIIYDANNNLILKNIDNAFTTCSAFVYSHINKTWKILNIGDSRIYRVLRQYKEQLTEDDNLPWYKNVITQFLWKDIDYFSLKEIVINKECLSDWNILLCSDGFYDEFEKNKVIFHKMLNYKRLWMTKTMLNRKIKNKNSDDASYIYIVTNI